MIQGVLFDLDGTLLDTAADLVGSLNHVRAAEGLGPVAVEDYRHLASRGALGLLGAGMPPGDAAMLQQRKRVFLEHYAANSIRLTAPFAGVPDLLTGLSSRGVPWGVVTNKAEHLTLPILRALGLLQSAACVICGDTLQYSKPHPAPVQLACEILHIESRVALMVGDDLRDIEAGQAAGAQTAFAAYGYVDPGLDHQHLAGSIVIDEPLELLRVIDAESRP